MFSKVPYFEFPDGHGKAKTVAVRVEPFLIGSGADCNLRIQSSAIADTQAEVTYYEGRWVLKVIGFAETSINDRTVTSDTLPSGSVVSFGDIATFVFRDPLADKAAKAAQKLAAAEQNTKQTSTEPRPVYRLPLLALFVSSMLMLIAYLWLQEPAQVAVNLTANTPATIDHVLYGDAASGQNHSMPLAACMALASNDASLAHLKDTDNGTFYKIASRMNDVDASEEELNKDFAELGKRLSKTFWMARESEARGRRQQALEGYRAVLEWVPDARCGAHVVAAARLANMN